MGNIRVMAPLPETLTETAAGKTAITLRNPRGGDSAAVGAGGVTLMGVVNRSPESISRDTYAADPGQAVLAADRYRKLGVRVMDVGGQSSSFLAPRLTTGEEIDRAVPTVAALAARGWVVSIDTFNPAVAEAALDAGAVLVNDTSGLQNPEMAALAVRSQVPFVLMYIEGDDPHNVRLRDDGEGKPRRAAARLEARRRELADRGITQVILDTGTGINYDVDYGRYARVQFALAEDLGAFASSPAPVMYTVPRKDDRHRIPALAALAMAAGADMLRIHDVEIISDIARLMGRLPRPPVPAGAQADAHGR